MDKEQQQAIAKRIERAIASYEDFTSTTREEIEFLYKEYQDIRALKEQSGVSFSIEFYGKIKDFKCLIDHNPTIQSFSSEKMKRLDKAFHQLGIFSESSTPQLSKAMMNLNIKADSTFTTLFNLSYGFAVINETVDAANDFVITDVQIFCETTSGEELLLRLDDIPLYSTKTKSAVIITSIQNQHGYTLMNNDNFNKVFIDRDTKMTNHYSLKDGRHELSTYNTKIVVPTEATKQKFHEGSLSFDAQITNYEPKWFGLSETSTTKNVRHTINFKVTNFGVGQ